MGGSAMPRPFATELIKDSQKLLTESRALCDLSKRNISDSKQAIAHGKARLEREETALNRIHLAESKDLAGQLREEARAPLLRPGGEIYSREFMEFVHKELWRIAAKLPRVEKALVDADVPRTFPLSERSCRRLKDA
jgi:hypothetical protein